MDLLAPGVSYGCAYGRLNNGWSLERAISEPPRKASPRRTYTERMAFYAAKRAAKGPPAVRKPMKKYAPHAPKRPTPPRIQKILDAYCTEFIKTGVLNPEACAKLKEYADERQTAKRNSLRVSGQPQVESYRAARGLARNDRDRDDHQTAGARDAGGA
jgi:hypothetical protein